MLTDPGALAADREARNEYLIEIDVAWELCRDAVEGARSNYETVLDTSRSAFEAERASASAVHGEGLDAAWAAYKTEVGQAGSRSRVEVMAEARAHYDAKLLEIRKVYEERVGIARDLYARTVEEARQGYEAGVDEALASHRGAVHKVVHLVPEPSSNAQVDQDVSYAAATVSGNGLYGEASGEAPGVIWSSDADSQSPEAREGELSSDPVTSSSDPVTSSSGPVLPGSDPVLSGLNGSSW